MSEFAGIFEVLATNDEMEQTSSRRVAAAAHRRIEKRFGDYLRKASSKEEFKSRLELIDDELHRVAKEVAREYGGSEESAKNAIRHTVTGFLAPKTTGCGCGGDCDGGCSCDGDCDCKKSSIKRADNVVGDYGAYSQGESLEEIVGRLDDEELEREISFAEGFEDDDPQAVEWYHALLDERERRANPSPWDDMEAGRGGYPRREGAVKTADAFERSWGEDYIGRPSVEPPGSCGRCGGLGGVPGEECPECGYTGGGEEDPVWGGGRNAAQKRSDLFRDRGTTDIAGDLRQRQNYPDPEASNDDLLQELTDLADTTYRELTNGEHSPEIEERLQNLQHSLDAAIQELQAGQHGTAADLLDEDSNALAGDIDRAWTASVKRKRHKKNSASDWYAGDDDYQVDPSEPLGLEFSQEPESINLEPDWESMRLWVKEVAKTDPEVAANIASAMGSEAPEDLHDPEFDPDAAAIAAEERYFDQRDPGNLYDIRGFGDDEPPEPDDDFHHASTKTARKPKLKTAYEDDPSRGRCPRCGYRSIEVEPQENEKYCLRDGCDWQESDGYGEDAQKIESSVRLARRPKLCPYHSEVVDISLTSGDPQAGYSAMASHAWGPKHCQGEDFEGKCNFKREMVTQTFWDQKAEQAEQRRQERELQQEVQVPDTIPEGLTDEPAPVEDTEPSINDDLAEAPSAVGEGIEEGIDMAPEMVTAAIRQFDSMAVKTADFGDPGWPQPQEIRDMEKGVYTCGHCGYRGESATDHYCPQCGEVLPIPDQSLGLVSSIKKALTAKDFVMIADAIATGPGDPGLLAEHFASYLGETNPNFDRERFIAAATGNPQTGRDRFQGGEPQLGMPVGEESVLGKPEYQNIGEPNPYSSSRKEAGPLDQSEYWGDLKPCPNCGEEAPVAGYNCPSCGEIIPETDPDTEAWMHSMDRGDRAFDSSVKQAGPVEDAGGAVVHEDLKAGNEDALDGPSPEIDKGKSGDERGWLLDDIDTEMEGSPHPTREQDVHDEADHTKKDFLDQTDAVTENQDLPSDTESAGFSSEKNIEQPATDTWSESNGTPPVTH